MNLSYKDELSENKTQLLKSICDFIKNEPEVDSDIGITQSVEDVINKYFDFLLDDEADVNIKNQSLLRIANLASKYPDNFFANFSPANFQSILKHAFQQETCSDAFYALCIINYFTDDFNEIIINSDLFIFLSDYLQEFNETQLNGCITLLLNLFVIIPIQRPLEVFLIDNLINLDILKIIRNPDIISIYSILMDKDDLPPNYINLIFKTLCNVLNQSNKSEVPALIEKLNKCKKRVLKIFDFLLNDDNRYQKHAISFINNNDIVRPLIIEMNESNVFYCLSIILKMLLKDDTFMPQLQAYKFEDRLICLCSNEKENIQHVALSCSIAYIKIFPEFSLKFSEFDFEGIFIDASFEIKASLIELYNIIFSLNIENQIMFTLNFSKNFLSTLLSMIGSGDAFVKKNAYCLLILFLKYNTIFIFDVEDDFEELTSEETVSMAENDSLCNISELANSASVFLSLIRKLISKSVK